MGGGRKAAVAVALSLATLVALAAPITLAAPVAAPKGYQGTTVRYVGNQVQLALNGTTTTVATDNPKRLDPMFAQLASVSPDGWTLLYVTADSEDMSNTALTTVNLKTQHTQVIASFGHSFWVYAPRWAPDGSRILYTQQSTTFNPQLWVMNATGAKAHMVTTGGPLTHTSYEGRVDRKPQWSADGKSIIFYESAYKPTKQWTVNVATGAVSNAAGVTPTSCPAVRHTIRPFSRTATMAATATRRCMRKTTNRGLAT